MLEVRMPRPTDCEHLMREASLTPAERWAIWQLRSIGYGQLADDIEASGTLASNMAALSPADHPVAWAILNAALIEHCASSCRKTEEGLRLDLPNPRSDDG